MINCTIGSIGLKRRKNDRSLSTGTAHFQTFHLAEQ